MSKKIEILLLLLLISSGKELKAGTGNVSDGLLSFVLLLGFLLLLLGLAHLAELLKVKIRKYLDGMGFEDLFGT